MVVVEEVEGTEDEAEVAVVTAAEEETEDEPEVKH